MPYGLYQPNVMYFGLTNSPPTFQKTMDRLFCPLKDKYPGMLFVYMDDILIATNDDLPLHQQIIHDILDLLEAESFFLKPSKCKFKCSLIDYLGIIVSNGAISIDPTKHDGLCYILRDFSHMHLHLALLCICDTRALDAMDQDALMAQHG
jgi:Reverse transcriptase (RNA-dependent DNA polymerase)